MRSAHTLNISAAGKSVPPAQQTPLPIPNKAGYRDTAGYNNHKHAAQVLARHKRQVEKHDAQQASSSLDARPQTNRIAGAETGTHDLNLSCISSACRQRLTGCPAPRALQAAGTQATKCPHAGRLTQPEEAAAATYQLPRLADSLETAAPGADPLGRLYSAALYNAAAPVRDPDGRLRAPNGRPPAGGAPMMSMPTSSFQPRHIKHSRVLASLRAGHYSMKRGRAGGTQRGGCSRAGGPSDPALPQIQVRAALDGGALPHPARPAPGAARRRRGRGAHRPPPRAAASSRAARTLALHDRLRGTLLAQLGSTGGQLLALAAGAGGPGTHATPPRPRSEHSRQCAERHQPPQDTRHAAGGQLGSTGGQQFALPAQTPSAHMQNCRHLSSPPLAAAPRRPRPRPQGGAAPRRAGMA